MRLSEAGRKQLPIHYEKHGRFDISDCGICQYKALKDYYKEKDAKNSTRR